MVDTVFLSLHPPDSREIKERINWAWLGCRLIGSAESEQEGTALLAERQAELIISCAAGQDQPAVEEQLAQYASGAEMLLAAAEEYSQNPEQCVGRLIDQIKAAVSRLEERRMGQADASFSARRAEETALRLCELAEARDYDGLRSVVFAYVERITAHGGDAQFVYMKIMELIVLAGYRPNQLESCFERLLRSDFSRKMQHMLQKKTDGLNRFLYRAICDSISLSGQRQTEQMNLSSFDNALEYIAENFSRKLTLDEVARQAYMSPSYFSNLVRTSANRLLPEGISVQC